MRYLSSSSFFGLLFWPGLAWAANKSQYANVQEVDVKESLKLLTSVPLKSFELKYGSSAGRRHIGFQAEDVQDKIPGGVTEIPRAHLQNPLRPHRGESTPSEGASGPSTMHVVDNGLVLWHTVGATQALSQQHEDMLNDTMRLSAAVQKHTGQIQTIFGDLEILTTTTANITRQLTEQGQSAEERRRLIAERSGQLALFSDSGDFIGDHSLTYDNGTLTVSHLSGHVVEGNIDYQHHRMANVNISGGTLSGISTLRSDTLFLSGKSFSSGGVLTLASDQSVVMDKEFTFSNGTLKTPYIAFSELHSSVDCKDHELHDVRLRRGSVKGFSSVETEQLLLPLQITDSIPVITKDGKLGTFSDLQYRNGTLTTQTAQLNKLLGDIESGEATLRAPKIIGGSLSGVARVDTKALTLSDFRAGGVLLIGKAGAVSTESELQFQNRTLIVPQAAIKQLAGDLDAAGRVILGPIVRGGSIEEAAGVAARKFTLLGGEKGEGGLIFLGKNGEMQVSPDIQIKEDGLISAPSLALKRLEAPLDFNSQPLSNVNIVGESKAELMLLRVNQLSVASLRDGEVLFGVDAGDGTTQTGSHKSLRFIDGILEAPKLSGHHVTGPVEFEGNLLENAAIRGGSAAGLTSLSTDALSITSSAAQPGRISFFDERRELTASELLVFNDATLSVPNLKVREVQSSVDFKNNRLTNVNIVNGKVTASSLTSTVLAVEDDVNIGGSLMVRGSVMGSGPYTDTSDGRFKENIEGLESPLEKLLELRGVTYDWKPSTGLLRTAHGARRQLGFVAQEVEKHIPEVVYTDEKGHKSIAYARIVPVLVEGIKELQLQIDAMKRELDTLKSSMR